MIDAGLPDLTRSDAGLVVVSTRIVDGPDRQRATADAIVAEWERTPWPTGLRSTSCFVSTDGTAVLTYAQWSSEEAYHEFVREASEQPDTVAYRLYRSGVRDGAPPPGCVVVVSVEFDGPDEDRLKRWVDTVFDALAAETEPHPGGISGHFHISADGTRVLNYAEWTDEQSHRDAIERSGQGTVGSGPKWREVKSFPGVRLSGFKRYHLFRGLARSE